MDSDPKLLVLRKSRTDPNSRLLRTTTTDAAAWMCNRLNGAHHPALNTNTDKVILDRDKEKFALLYEEKTPDLTKIYLKAENKKLEFMDIVEGYNTVARARNGVPMDIQELHGWSNTLGSYGNAIEKSRQIEQKGFRNFLKRSFRKLGDRSSMFEAWLQILPKESHYLSILCGGIQLLLGAAGRMAEIRERIYEILDEIPSMMSAIEEFQDVFMNSSELHGCSANFYIAVLDMLGSIVEHYTKHVGGRITSAIFKQSLSGQDICEKIKIIHVYRNRLNDMVRVCSEKRQQRIEQGLRDIQRQWVQSDHKNDKNNNEIMWQHEDILQELKQARLERIEHRQAIEQQHVDVLNRFLEMLKGSTLRLVSAGSRAQELDVGGYSGSVATSREPSPMLSYEEDCTELLNALLRYLAIEQSRDIAAEDSKELLHLTLRQSPRSQTRAVTLMGSEKLRSWVRSVTSGSLLVNGRITEIEEQRQSALSFVSNNLAETIVQSDSRKSAYVTRWFCGRHTDMVDYGNKGPTDYDAHPPGMMINMTSQLILQILNSPQISSININDIPQGPINQDISSLCDMFEQIIGLLPPEAIVFCIIDGISYYEDEERKLECLEAISRLTMLASKHSIEDYGCLFKLLVTAPYRAHTINTLFDEDEILDMDEDMSANEELTTLRLRAGLDSMWLNNEEDR